jgi:hypothetical protein
MYTIALLLLASTPAATSTAPATTDDGGGTGASTRSTADGWGYHEGSIQIFLDAPPLTAQYTINTPVAGKGFAYRSFGNGFSTFSFGLSGGIGYCLTPVLEFGGALAFNLYTTSGGAANSTNFDFALEPFAKFNLATVFGSGGINPFATVGPVLGFGQLGTAGEGLTGVAGIDMDLGAEFFIERHWGITAYVPIQIISNTGYSSNVNFIIGVGFGLFGYLGSEPINIRIN